MSLNLELWRMRFQEYMELRGWTSRTVESYASELRPFFEFLESQAIESLGCVTRETVQEYRTHLFYVQYRDRRISTSTQCSRLTRIKSFLRFLAREHFLLTDPAAQVELPCVPRRIPRTLLSERETLILLEAPDTTTPLGIRDRSILELLYCTAIRNTELRRLSLDDIDTEQRVLRIVCGKGNKSRVVPLGEEAIVWLEEYLVHGRPRLVRRTSTTVFLTWRGKPFSRGSLSRVVRQAARAARLKKAVTPHVLRHCCATHMLRRGANICHLQELLGHESAATTQRYTKVEISDLHRVLERCHPRERRQTIP